MHRDRFDQIIGLVHSFFTETRGVLAIGLCGSWARGTAHADSDIDLIVLVQNKGDFKSTNWIHTLAFEMIDDKIVGFEDIKYGCVWSRHVYLKSGTAIEFSFGDTSWANTEPLDTGTRKVVADGFRILYDPNRMLDKLIKKIKAKP